MQSNTGLIPTVLKRKNLIHKSIYLNYLKCEKNAWLKLNKPELKQFFIPSESDQHRMDQGNAVELISQQLFPSGITMNYANTHDAVIVTQHHINLKTAVLFQPTFIWNKFLVRNDILEYDEQTQAWNLYEVKATTSVKEEKEGFDHIEDIASQVIVLKALGLQIAKASIIHLSKEYALQDTINIQDLFTIVDVTHQVKTREQDTKIKMQEAQVALLVKNENELSCNCIYKGRSAHCETFSYSHKNIPEYSVHDIARIGNSKKKLEILINQKIFEIKDMPENLELTEPQKNQVHAYQMQKNLIKNKLIKQELDSLKYPLYFLDYETYSFAIPLFKGYKPYQQTVFQFSVHVITEEQSAPVHIEYLHELESDPSLTIIQKLLQAIGPIGNIIVWHKSFEQGRNVELALLHPEYKEFLDDINNRMYDLEDIFSKQMYVDYDFKGKTSLKNILPVLVPKLSYNELKIQAGEVASLRWFNMVYGQLTKVEQQAIVHELKRYCSLDTYAMYKIWQHLHTLLKIDLT